jgi:hypothetical protein
MEARMCFFEIWVLSFNMDWWILVNFIPRFLCSVCTTHYTNIVFTKLEFSKFQLIFKKCLCIAAFTVEPTVIGDWRYQVNTWKQHILPANTEYNVFWRNTTKLGAIGFAKKDYKSRETGAITRMREGLELETHCHIFFFK